MAINKAFDRHFVTIGGAVKTSGGSLTLAKGQLAIVDQSKTTPDGAVVLSSFLGKPKHAKDLAIRVGITEKTPNKTYSNKGESSAPFALNEIKKLRVSAPQRTTQSVDELVIGYDGFDASTSFAFKTGDRFFNMTVELSGGPLQYRGGAGETEIVNINVEIPDCDPFNTCEDCDNCEVVDCKAITLEAIERLKNKQLTGGNLLSEFVDVTPVFSCDNPATADLIPYIYYTISVCDTGDDNALAMLQAQYDEPVIRTNRTGSTSTYQILVAESEGAPDDYAQTLASIIKGCEDCPAGYTEAEGGYVYAITIEDDGVAYTTQITTNLANAKYVTGTLIKSGNSAGVGFYTAVYSSPITAAELATFTSVSTNARNTATVDLVGRVADVCTNATVTETPWVAGDTCNAVQERYSIVLPDNECGENRLAELQGAYANLTVYAFNSTLGVTLTGTGGTAVINIGGTNYSQLFTTNLTTTAAAFVTAHAAAILAATGVVVTSSGAVLTFAGQTYYLDGLTVTNNAANGALTLTGTSGTANVNVDGTNYLATFATNLTTTAANFVTAHAAAILAATGLVVTSSGAVITFIGSSDIVSAITILNATGDLAGTLAVTLALDGTIGTVTAVFDGTGCQNKYEVLVTSDLVCEECSPVFLDYYVTSVPAAYDLTEWTSEPTAPSTPYGNCLCGIRIKGKVFYIEGDEALRDMTGFTESSTMIQASAGYPAEIREGIGALPQGTYPVKYLSRWIPRTHLAGNLLDLEREGRAYFLDLNYRHDYLGRILRGETSNFDDLGVQFVDYVVEIGHEGYTQSFGGTNSKNIEYHIFVEVGRHAAIETLLNNMAAAAGVEGVRAFGA